MNIILFIDDVYALGFYYFQQCMENKSDLIES